MANTADKQLQEDAELVTDLVEVLRALCKLSDARFGVIMTAYAVAGEKSMGDGLFNIHAFDSAERKLIEGGARFIRELQRHRVPKNPRNEWVKILFESEDSEGGPHGNH